MKYPYMIQVGSNEPEIVFSFNDFRDLIRRHAGNDARRYVEIIVRDYEDEISNLKHQITELELDLQEVLYGSADD